MSLHWAEVKSVEDVPECVRCCEEATKTFTICSGKHLVVDVDSVADHNLYCHWCGKIYGKLKGIVVVYSPEETRLEGKSVLVDGLYIDTTPIVGAIITKQ